eukprot:gene4977-896_t
MQDPWQSGPPIGQWDPRFTLGRIPSHHSMRPADKARGNQHRAPKRAPVRRGGAWSNNDLRKSSRSPPRGPWDNGQAVYPVSRGDAMARWPSTRDHAWPTDGLNHTFPPPGAGVAPLPGVVDMLVKPPVLGAALPALLPHAQPPTGPLLPPIQPDSQPACPVPPAALAVSASPLLPQLVTPPTKPTADPITGAGVDLDAVLDQAKTRAEALWEELRTPAASRQALREQWSQASAETLAVVNAHVLHCVAVRDATVQVEKCIELRENLLFLLSDTAAQSPINTADLVALVTQTRDTSLDVVDAVVVWRQVSGQPHSAYNWGGRPYFAKMYHDLAFLAPTQAPALLGCVLSFNPFLLPTIPPRGALLSLPPGNPTLVRATAGEAYIADEMARLGLVTEDIGVVKDPQLQAPVPGHPGYPVQVMPTTSPRVASEPPTPVALVPGQPAYPQVAAQTPPGVRAAPHPATRRESIQGMMVERSPVPGYPVGNINPGLDPDPGTKTADDLDNPAVAVAQAKTSPRDPVERLQAWVRGCLARQRAGSIRKRWQAACNIQRVWRGHTVRHSAKLGSAAQKPAMQTSGTPAKGSRPACTSHALTPDDSARQYSSIATVGSSTQPEPSYLLHNWTTPATPDQSKQLDSGSPDHMAPDGAPHSLALEEPFPEMSNGQINHEKSTGPSVPEAGAADPIVSPDSAVQSSASTSGGGLIVRPQQGTDLQSDPHLLPARSSFSDAELPRMALPEYAAPVPFRSLVGKWRTSAGLLFAVDALGNTSITGGNPGDHEAIGGGFLELKHGCWFLGDLVLEDPATMMWRYHGPNPAQAPVLALQWEAVSELVDASADQLEGSSSPQITLQSAPSQTSSTDQSEADLSGPKRPSQLLIAPHEQPQRGSSPLPTPRGELAPGHDQVTPLCPTITGDSNHGQHWEKTDTGGTDAKDLLQFFAAGQLYEHLGIADIIAEAQAEIQPENQDGAAPESFHVDSERVQQVQAQLEQAMVQPEHPMQLQQGSFHRITLEVVSMVGISPHDPPKHVTVEFTMGLTSIVTKEAIAGRTAPIDFYVAPHFHTNAPPFPTVGLECQAGPISLGHASLILPQDVADHPCVCQVSLPLRYLDEHGHWVFAPGGPSLVVRVSLWPSEQNCPVGQDVVQYNAASWQGAAELFPNVHSDGEERSLQQDTSSLELENPHLNLLIEQCGPAPNLSLALLPATDVMLLPTWVPTEPQLPHDRHPSTVLPGPHPESTHDRPFPRPSHILPTHPSVTAVFEAESPLKVGSGLSKLPELVTSDLDDRPGLPPDPQSPYALNYNGFSKLNINLWNVCAKRIQDAYKVKRAKELVVNLRKARYEQRQYNRAAIIVQRMVRLWKARNGAVAQNELSSPALSSRGLQPNGQQQLFKLYDDMMEHHKNRGQGGSPSSTYARSESIATSPLTPMAKPPAQDTWREPVGPPSMMKSAMFGSDDWVLPVADPSPAVPLPKVENSLDFSDSGVIAQTTVELSASPTEVSRGTFDAADLVTTPEASTDGALDCGNTSRGPAVSSPGLEAGTRAGEQPEYQGVTVILMTGPHQFKYGITVAEVLSELGPAGRLVDLHSKDVLPHSHVLVADAEYQIPSIMNNRASDLVSPTADLSNAACPNAGTAPSEADAVAVVNEAALCMQLAWKCYCARFERRWRETQRDGNKPPESSLRPHSVPTPDAGKELGQFLAAGQLFENLGLDALLQEAEAELRSEVGVQAGLVDHPLVHLPLLLHPKDTPNLAVLWSTTQAAQEALVAAAETALKSTNQVNASAGSQDGLLHEMSIAVTKMQDILAFCDDFPHFRITVGSVTHTTEASEHAWGKPLQWKITITADTRTFPPINLECYSGENLVGKSSLLYALEPADIAMFTDANSGCTGFYHEQWVPLLMYTAEKGWHPPPNKPATLVTLTIPAKR